MATAVQAPVAAPADPAGETQLALELADAFHLIAACWSRNLRVPEQLLDHVDGLLDLVEAGRLGRGNIA
jgi:hypothetical protein